MFFEVRGVPTLSQNDSQNASKIKLRCGGPPGEPPGAIWEGLGGPRSSPEAPQSVSGEPQERRRRLKVSPRRSKMTPRRAQMTPRRGKMSPRRARVSSGRSREASGSDLGMISEAFPSNLRARARAARHPPHSQSSCSRCSRHVGFVVPPGALLWFFSPFFVLLSSCFPSLSRLAG